MKVGKANNLGPGYSFWRHSIKLISRTSKHRQFLLELLLNNVLFSIRFLIQRL